MAAAPRKAGPVPSEFYVVQQFFSDMMSQWANYILDVRPDGDDTVVRLVRIAQVDDYCATNTVQLAEARLKAILPGALVGRNNPCAVSAEELKRNLHRFAQLGSIWDTSKFGIVARCGTEEVSLQLPYLELVNEKKMKAEVPRVWRLWNLLCEVQQRAFGKSPFSDLSGDQRWQLQTTGQAVVPELLSGRFDKGFGGRAFNALKYHGPVRSAPQRGRLLNAEQFQFAAFTAPVFPPLALQARISGNVDLVLGVHAKTGEVADPSVISGHPLLASVAYDAARKWRFAPGSVGDEVRVTIEFEVRCP
jgi:hypothetical protein